MDIFYTSTPDPQDELEPASGGVAGRVAAAPAKGSVEADEQVPAAVRQVILADSAEWHSLLQAAGFSRAEAGRLVFERMRPRDEGLIRNAAAG